MSEASNIFVGVAGYFGKPDHPGKVGIFRRAAKGGDWQHVLGLHSVRSSRRSTKGPRRDE